MQNILYPLGFERSSRSEKVARKRRRRWDALLMVVAIGLLVALIDFSMPAGIAVSLFYSLTILACGWIGSRSTLAVTTLVCEAMNLLGARFGPAPHHGIPPLMVWSNRGLVGVFLIIVAVVIERWINGRDAADERNLLLQHLACTFDLAQAIVRDTDGRILFWSQGAEVLYGWTAEEAVGKISHQLLRTEFAIPQAEIEDKLGRTSRWTGELRHIRKTGEEIWVASEWALGSGRDGHGELVIEVNNDITGLKRSEQALAASERRFGRISESNVVGVILSDREQLLEANDHFLMMLGYTRPEAVGMKWREMVAPESIDKHVAAYRLLRDSGSAAPFETELTAKDQSRVPVLIGSVALDDKFLSFVIDETERKRLKAQLAQAQKLESIGKLAGGIAHDFNNLLTVIIGHAELVLDGMKQPDPARAKVQQISTAANAAAELTKQLLAFSRHQPDQLRYLALNDTVRDLEGMLRRVVREDVALTVELGPDAGIICGSPLQLEQVLFQLVTNAREAMPHGGKLAIETARIFVDSDYADTHFGVKPGHYAMLTVGDTGVGMPPPVKERIFEPFFSTKGPGRGTGLGLATVYGIVSKMGGSIAVYSEQGQGTVFKLLFPLVQEMTEAPAPLSLPAWAIAPGTGTILLAEDEAGVRDYVRRILENHGYRVLAAANGREALALAADYQGSIDLLLTDAVMPEMGGDELTARLLEQRPEVVTLRMSGYTDRLWREQKGNGAMLIQKPFTAAALLGSLQKTLADRTVKAEV